MTFDPAKYGAKPVATSTQGFDPNKYGAKPVQSASVMPQPAPKQDGFFNSVAKGIVTPVARLALNAGQAIQQAGNIGTLLKQGPSNYDPSKLTPIVQNKTTTVPWLGDIKPVGQEGGALQQIKDIYGTGAQFGSTFAGGSGFARVASATLGGRVLTGLAQGLGSGAIGGGFYSAGTAAVNNQSIKDISNSFLTGTIGGAVGGSVLSSAFPLIGAGTRSLYNKVVTPKVVKVEQEIVNQFEKGVKPNLPGKTTPTTRTRFNNQIVEGVNVIRNNKAGLEFVDDTTGEVVVGKTPQTLKQFSDAIEQTKNRIYAQYDDLATRAGENGVKVDPLPIANELDQVINNKALQLSHPDAVAYAQQVQNRFRTAGPLDAKTAQDVIQNYNNSLQAFYRNPTPEGLTRNAVDSMMVNRIRRALDEGIEGLTGAQYQAIKNQYGALKAIERDVMRATLRDARKNIKGLIDYTDIFSGGQVVSGILSANPAAVASGLTQKGISQYFKYLNNPNRAVQQMFQAADRLPVPPATIPLSTRKQLPAGPMGTPGNPAIRSSVTGGAAIPVAPSNRSILYPQSRIQIGGDSMVRAQSNQLPANNLRATSPTASMSMNGTRNVIPTSKPRTPSQSTDLSTATRQVVSSPKSTPAKASVANDPAIIRRLTRERGAVGTPSDEWLLASAQRELKKTPNDAKLKAFVAEKELMAEARKYKSAEEFVKGQEGGIKQAQTGKPVTARMYHGSPDARFAEEFDPTKAGYYKDVPDLLPDMREWESLNGKPSQGFRGESVTGNKGVSFTDSRATAKSYSEKPAFDTQNSVPMVLERYVTLKNPKVYDMGGKKWDLNMEQEMRKALENGHDGLVFKNILDDYHPFNSKTPANNIIVLDTNAIKTRSQLTDIWNKANKGNQTPVLPNQLKKVSDAGGVQKYGMSHRPAETGATADDISKGGEVIPKDFYEHPEWYANMKDKSYQESFSALNKIKGNPNATVTIYRASPKNEINRGDWVSLSKTYAKGESLSEKTPVHSFKVKAKDIQFAGDDINEFGYYPKD